MTPDQRRIERLHIVQTLKERAMLEKAARKNGETISAFVRRAISERLHKEQVQEIIKSIEKAT